MKVAPTPLGLLKHDGQEHEINVSNYYMGKKYALALSNSMKYLKTKKLNLHSNNLGSKGSKAILSNLPGTLEELDLSNNDMGDEAIPQLIEWLENSTVQPPKNLDIPKMNIMNKFISKSHSLKSLNLSSNKLTDKYLYNLCDALIVAHPPLVYLDLSHNKLET